MTEWTNLLGLWRRMGKNGKWSRTLTPRPLSGTLRSHRDLKRIEERSGGTELVCFAAAPESVEAQNRKNCKNFADRFGTSLLFHGSPRNYQCEILWNIHHKKENIDSTFHAMTCSHSISKILPWKRNQIEHAIAAHWLSIYLKQDSRVCFWNSFTTVLLREPGAANACSDVK